MKNMNRDLHKRVINGTALTMAAVLLSGQVVFAQENRVNTEPPVSEVSVEVLSSEDMQNTLEEQGDSFMTMIRKDFKKIDKQKKAEAAAEEEARRIAEEQERIRQEQETLLAALIQCEAGNQSYTGKVAVGAVVMNRVKSHFEGASSIRDVIYASHQFTPVSNGTLSSALASGPWESCREAARAAMSGYDPTGGCKYFRTVNGHAGLVIGAHVFY